MCHTIRLYCQAAFDFAFKMVGNIGHLGPDIEHQSLPGVTTAFQPNDPSHCHGLLGIMELPIMLDQHKPKDDSHPPTTVAEDQVEASPLRPLLTRQNAINSTSTDSGYDDAVIPDTKVTSTPIASSIENPTASLEQLNHPEALSKSDNPIPISAPSEPIKDEDGKKESKWKMLSRNKNRLQLQPSTKTPNPAKPPNPSKNPQLSELILEAMLILNEAEARGTNLTKL